MPILICFFFFSFPPHFSLFFSRCFPHHFCWGGIKGKRRYCFYFFLFFLFCLWDSLFPHPPVFTWGMGLPPPFFFSSSFSLPSFFLFLFDLRSQRQIAGGSKKAPYPFFFLFPFSFPPLWHRRLIHLNYNFPFPFSLPFLLFVSFLPGARATEQDMNSMPSFFFLVLFARTFWWVSVDLRWCFLDLVLFFSFFFFFFFLFFFFLSVPFLCSFDYRGRTRGER